MKSGDKGEYQIYYRAMLCLILMLTFFVLKHSPCAMFIYPADKLHLRNPQFADIDLLLALRCGRKGAGALCEMARRAPAKRLRLHTISYEIVTYRHRWLIGRPNLHGVQENANVLSCSVTSIGNVLQPCTARLPISCVFSRIRLGLGAPITPLR